MLVAAGALWLAAFFCVVGIHHPKPGVDGLFDSLARFPHRSWHHHSVGAGTESAAAQGPDTCAICVARAGFRSVAASASLSHPAGGHGEALSPAVDRLPAAGSTRRPPARGPPIV